MSNWTTLMQEDQWPLGTAAAAGTVDPDQNELEQARNTYLGRRDDATLMAASVTLGVPGNLVLTAQFMGLSDCIATLNDALAATEARIEALEDYLDAEFKAGQ